MVPSVPAIVMAGDRGAARAVHGQSKVYLEVAEQPLVAHVVAILQRVPQVSSVWVVGDALRLRAALGGAKTHRILVAQIALILLAVGMYLFCERSHCFLHGNSLYRALRSHLSTFFARRGGPTTSRK